MAWGVLPPVEETIPPNLPPIKGDDYGQNKVQTSPIFLKYPLFSRYFGLV
jgi:hypothetical protein